MKVGSKHSLSLLRVCCLLVLVAIFVFLPFTPFSSDVYGDTADPNLINDSNYGIDDSPEAIGVDSNTNKTFVTNYDLNTIPVMDSSTMHNTSSPNATVSWQFSSQLQNSIAVGSTKIEEKSGVTSLHLVGDGYLITKDYSTRDLSKLTISAWVKPDYRQGSAIFTIISRDNQFVLSINNIISPIRTATFSIFDGMKWQTVNSDTQTGKHWTQVAATFNGTTINIYVNGTLKSSLEITGTPSISVNGELETKNVNHLFSNSDIVIGAYLSTLRGKVSNQFSGSISDVNLYDSVLDQSQIANLYAQHIPSGKVDHTSLPHAIINSAINGIFAISDDVTILKTPTNYNYVSSDQIIRDIVITNSTTDANYTTPAYFIPFEPPLNSTMYTNSTIQANLTSLNSAINNTSLLNGTSLLNSTTR